MSFYLLPGIRKATHTKVLLITNTDQWPESQQHKILIRSYIKENAQKKMFLNCVLDYSLFCVGVAGFAFV